MKIQFDCCECIFSQLIRMSKELDEAPERRWEFFSDAVGLFQQYCRNATPPELAARYFARYTALSGTADQYQQIKDNSTAIARKLYAELEPNVSTFSQRLKLAISGNMIDYGVNPDFDLANAEDFIRDAMAMEIDNDAAADLEQRINSANNILYILDNCGEAVFDRLLLETMKDKVTIAVRGGAIINDITRREIAASDLADFPLIDTGCAAPGAPLPLISAKFKSALENADLIIAKGQGNFESLEGDFHARPIYFLFRAKCPVIQKYTNSLPESIQIIGRNLNLSR